MSLIVFGSLNMDLVARVGHLPQPGETLLGESFTTLPGGKGANQAVAAARLGATVRMLGRVGRDDFGQVLIQALQVEGIDTTELIRDAHQPSGVALVAVSQTGENQIIVIPGANGAISEVDLTPLARALTTAKWLLLQFEIPLPIVLAAAQLAKQAGVTVIVDPAPACADLPADFYAQVDILTPNQTEATQLVGFTVCDRTSAQAAGQILHQKGVATVIVKLGSLGVVAVTHDHCLTIPAFAVDVVDTVAAGDAFNGGLAVALSEGKPLSQALVWASAVAALAVTRPGAQAALPHRTMVEDFLQRTDDNFQNRCTL